MLADNGKHQLSIWSSILLHTVVYQCPEGQYFEPLLAIIKMMTILMQTRLEQLQEKRATGALGKHKREFPCEFLRRNSNEKEASIKREPYAIQMHRYTHMHAPLEMLDLKGHPSVL